MAGSFFCRKCLSFAAKKWVVVSRVGPSTIPSSSDNIIGNEDGSNGGAFIILVIALAVSALACLCMFVLIFQNNPLWQQRPAETNTRTAAVPVVNQVQALKKVEDDDACEKGSWSVQSVELVVMAGEDMPTFLAHPVPAPSKAKYVVQCPPLNL